MTTDGILSTDASAALDEAYNKAFSQYSQSLSANNQLKPASCWQNISDILAETDAAPPSEVEPEQLAEWASKWIDSPESLGEQQAAFESALPNWPEANTAITEMSALSTMLKGYGRRLMDSLPVSNGIKGISPAALVQLATAETSHASQPQPAPVIELFPRWAVSIVAVSLLFVTVNIGQPAQSVDSNLLASAQGNLSIIPSVEAFVLSSCDEAVPDDQWQVTTKCQF
jgi:hypothetical protein